MKRCAQCGAVAEALGLFHRPTCPVSRAAAAAATVPARKPRMAHLYTGPDACIYCARKVGRGGVTINRTDGGDDHAHAACHAKACRE